MLAGEQTLSFLPQWLQARPLLRTTFRYSLSTVGPVCVSAAHFAASLIFLRLLQAAEFGQFSFLLIVVPFCLSAAGALLGAPASLTRAKDDATASAEIATLQKTSLLVAAVAGLVVAFLMLSTSATPAEAALFGLYGAGATLRSFARSLANVRAQLLRVAGSDIVYAALLVAGLVGLIATGHLTMASAAVVLALAALAGFVPFGWSYLGELIRAAATPALLRYLPMCTM